MPRLRTSLVPLALSALLLAGCGGEDAPESTAAVASGNPDTCTGEVVDVVVSVGQWGDVVRRVGGDCANVTTVLASGDVDPHEADPTAADLAAFADADLVVVNGAGYDRWAEDAAEAQEPEPAVLTVTDLLDEPAGSDPHVWSSPAAVHALAPALAEELGQLSPDAADVFEANAATWQAELRQYLDAVLALGSTVSGRTYAATEPAFDRMADALGLVDATPEGYRRSAARGEEPAPGDLSAFESALADGSVDVLVLDEQTGGDAAEALRSAADDAGVPVVEVTEAPADQDEPFLDWQLAQLTALGEALGAAR
ncbi:metal ABC transporter solute-binding protein, Zn/Mn family [Blastococcus litoris]|uniref:metal ABC transporter solute-binding protein, Zn/Mn family n=1 Tax=Blastococcus litoris TaxID=2171622 RepID=UPI000E307F6D|nr:zinc ABC transporter substrate-binding protein [Blastococcus litoris]